jgi:2-methylcitrate dehydratase PrpD
MTPPRVSRTRESTLAPTAHLAAWAAEVHYGEVPPAVTDFAKGLILDFIRATATGARTPWATGVRDLIVQLGGSGRSTTFFFGDRLDPARAALVNGALAHATDMDDTHVGAMLHPGAAILPAVFAVAEDIDAPGQEVLSAMVVGYETAVRIALAVQPSHFQRGFQATATCGVFGAAAGAGRLLHLDADALAGALGIAGSSAAGLAQFYYSGSLVKRIHAGCAAQSGVMAALFAGAGLEGPRDILEGEAGFGHAYADKFDPTRILSGLGTDFKLPEVTIKPHATSARFQSAVEVALVLAAERGIRTEDIVAIEVAIPRVILGKLTQRNPPDVSAAQLSLPFTVGLAFTLGQRRGGELPLTVDDYRTWLDDAGVRRLARVTECRVDDEIDAGTTDECVPARISVTLADGSAQIGFIERPLGAPGRPLSPAQRDSLFSASLEGIASAAVAKGITEAVEELDQADSVQGLTRLLVSSDGPGTGERDGRKRPR